MLSNQNDTHVSVMLFYCLKVDIGEEEVKICQNFVYYIMDGLLQMLSHIRIRLIKSSFDFFLYKSLQIIFNYYFEQKICGKVKHELRVKSSDVRFTSSNELQI